MSSQIPSAPELAEKFLEARALISALLHDGSLPRIGPGEEAQEFIHRTRKWAEGAELVKATGVTRRRKTAVKPAGKEFTLEELVLVGKEHSGPDSPDRVKARVGLSGGIQELTLEWGTRTDG